MLLDIFRSSVTSRPGLVVMAWLVAVVGVGLFAPDLTRLAAEGQANLLDGNSESFRADETLRQAWPDRAYESLAVAALHRAGGITSDDLGYARRLAARIDEKDRPRSVLRVLGPDSPPEIAVRLLSKDGTVALVVVPLSTSFVSPTTHEAIAWLESRTRAGSLSPPGGLEVRWAGDAMIGRDYMANVQTSLDRAAAATAVLLLGVLLIVYRSVWLALVPLTTIAISLVISRGILAWLNLAGWEVSPLVELFLVALLFGSGTDFCLFISWKFGEHWDATNPAGAMRVALARSTATLLTGAGTVIVGLSLMGTTRFKLFSSTGPSVALGLAITLLAALTLTPALLVILGRFRPRALTSLTSPSSGLWEGLARAALARPVMSWLVTVLAMAPLAILGLRSGFVQDVITEMPRETASVRNLRWLATKFNAGSLTPLNVVLSSDSDLRDSVGLALIDDISRFLARQRRISEVRSATQPTGSRALLEPARLSERLRAVNAGYGQMESGSRELQDGLNAGAARLRLALWVEEHTGLALTAPPGTNGGSLAAYLERARVALLGGTGTNPKLTAGSAGTAPGNPPGSIRANDPRTAMVDELRRAAEGAGATCRGGRTRPPGGFGDPRRPGRPPLAGAAPDYRGNHPRTPRPVPELRHLYHARRPDRPDRSDPGRPVVLGCRHGSGGRPPTPHQRVPRRRRGPPRDGPDHRRKRRVGRHPGIDPLGPGPELVRGPYRRLPRPDADPP